MAGKAFLSLTLVTLAAASPPARNLAAASCDEYFKDVCIPQCAAGTANSHGACGTMFSKACSNEVCCEAVTAAPTTAAPPPPPGPSSCDEWLKNVCNPQCDPITTVKSHSSCGTALTKPCSVDVCCDPRPTTVQTTVTTTPAPTTIQTTVTTTPAPTTIQTTVTTTPAVTVTTTPGPQPCTTHEQTTVTTTPVVLTTVTTTPAVTVVLTTVTTTPAVTVTTTPAPQPCTTHPQAVAPPAPAPAPVPAPVANPCAPVVPRKYSADMPVLVQETGKKADAGMMPAWALPVLGVFGMFSFISFVAVRARRSTRSTRQLQFTPVEQLLEENALIEDAVLE